MHESANHNFHNSILRAYDIRGIVGQTLNYNDAYHLGRGFASYIKEQYNGNKIIVAFDGRTSSPQLEEYLVKGLITSGAEIVRIGIGPTPMLYFSVKHLKADAGIMITGSHNPPTHNGFKMMAKSLPIHGDNIIDIGKICLSGNYIKNSGSVTFEDVKEAYLQNLIDALIDTKKSSLWAKKLNKLKIAWDAGNGAAGQIMEQLCSSLPGNHILLNEKIDGNFPAHHPDPSDIKNLQQLIKCVIDNQCDLGIAFDGDGDRIGIVDEKGQMIMGDQLLSLFAIDLLQEKPASTIIGDVKSSKVLFDIISNHGGKPLMWKTGHSLIKTKMAQIGAELAGEVSGHIFFKENNNFDDGLFAAVKIINFIAKRDEKLSYYCNQLPKTISTAEIRLDVNEDEKFAIIDNIKNNIINNNSKNIELITIDGVRANYHYGWWLIRASNTQAALVARCEADNKDNLNKLVNELKSILASNKVNWPIDFNSL